MILHTYWCVYKPCFGCRGDLVLVLFTLAWFKVSCCHNGIAPPDTYNLKQTAYWDFRYQLSGVLPDTVTVRAHWSVL